MHLRELVCKFFRNEVSSIFTISSIVSSGEILRLVLHLFVSLKCWLKRFGGGLMWIQRLALHLVIMTKIFSVITLTQNAIKGA